MCLMSASSHSSTLYSTCCNPYLDNRKGKFSRNRTQLGAYILADIQREDGKCCQLLSQPALHSPVGFVSIDRKARECHHAKTTSIDNSRCSPSSRGPQSYDLAIKARRSWLQSLRAIDIVHKTQARNNITVRRTLGIARLPS